MPVASYSDYDKNGGVNRIGSPMTDAQRLAKEQEEEERKKRKKKKQPQFSRNVLAARLQR